MDNINQVMDEYLKLKKISIVGVSRKKKFGNMLYDHFKTNGYVVSGVNPNMDSISGDKCYHSLSEITDKPDLVILATRPKNAKNVLEECSQIGINKVFFAKGSETEQLLEYCKEKNITAVYDSCPFLHFKTPGFHKFHRFMNKIFKKKPKFV